MLEHLIAPASLTGVRVFFPDPWPKARHHKRRLLQPATVGLIADRLLPGGVLHAATDHPGYAEQIAEVGDAEPRLCRVDPGSPLPISVVRPTTKYEIKAHEAGSCRHRIDLEKTMTMSLDRRNDRSDTRGRGIPGGGFRLGAPGPSDSDSSSRRVLLVWDAPNLDMGLGSILGRRPTALERPRFDALGRWLLAPYRGGQRGAARRRRRTRGHRLHQHRAGQRRSGSAVGGCVAQRGVRGLRQAEDRRGQRRRPRHARPHRTAAQGRARGAGGGVRRRSGVSPAAGGNRSRRGGGTRSR